MNEDGSKRNDMNEYLGDSRVPGNAPISQEGIARALMDAFPCDATLPLPDDMKKLLGHLGWHDIGSAI